MGAADVSHLIEAFLDRYFTRYFPDTVSPMMNLNIPSIFCQAFDNQIFSFWLYFPSAAI